MTKEEVQSKLSSLGQWYHEIQLMPDVITDSLMLPWKNQWDNVRKVRQRLDYKGKSVLDLGTMNGMWAFEAEQLGAEKVVAGDIWQNCSHMQYERLIFAKSVLNSKIFVVTNAEITCLHDRLESSFRLYGIKDGFDIIQCLGLIYHVEDILKALREVHKCLKQGGQLLIETACWVGGGDEPLCRFNSDYGIYPDSTTYWAPNKACLYDMLKHTGFNPTSEMSILHSDVDRICLIATK